MLTQASSRRARAVAVTLALTAASATASARTAFEAEDDLQRNVSLDAPAERIVSLAPHLTELVHSAGAGGKLVGVSRRCDYPPQVERLPYVSDYATINYELIAELKPDLVLVWNAGLKAASLNKLSTLYRNVYVSDPADFEGIAENLREIGLLAGTEAQARRRADEFLQEIHRLGARRGRARPVKTLYLLWRDPPMTVNGEHWISRVVGLCGGVNVFEDAVSGVVKLNRESLLLARPDVVLHSLSDYAHRPGSLSDSLGLAEKVPAFYVGGDLIQRPSLRLAQSAAALCRILSRAGEPSERS